MSVTAPRAGVPIGYVNIGGKRVPVEVDPEYLRYFSDMLVRVGGVTGPGTIDLTISQFEDAGIAEQQAEFYSFVTSVGQGPSGLHEELAVLRTEIEAIKQGLML